MLEPTTLNLGVVGLSPTLVMESTLKNNKIWKKKKRIKAIDGEGQGVGMERGTL